MLKTTILWGLGGERSEEVRCSVLVPKRERVCVSKQDAGDCVQVTLKLKDGNDLYTPTIKARLMRWQVQARSAGDSRRRPCFQMVVPERPPLLNEVPRLKINSCDDHSTSAPFCGVAIERVPVSYLAARVWLLACSMSAKTAEER